MCTIIMQTWNHIIILFYFIVLLSVFILCSTILVSTFGYVGKATFIVILLYCIYKNILFCLLPVGSLSLDINLSF